VIPTVQIDLVFGVLNPYALNEQAGSDRNLMAPRYLGWDVEEKTLYSYGDLIADRAIDWEEPLAIYPIQRVARMRGQRSWFSIHGSDRGDPTEVSCAYRLRGRCSFTPNIRAEF